MKKLTTYMPVTEEIYQNLSKETFTGYTIIHINHLLNDVLDLNLVFQNLGAEVIFIPILYSRTRKIPKTIYKTISPDASGNLLDSGISDALLQALTEVNMQAQRKVIIVSDGGYHFQVFEQLGHNHFPNIELLGTIEQTANGVRKAAKFIGQQNGYCHPVLSVARSLLKMRFENYFLANRIVDEISYFFYDLEEFLSFRSILIIGYGVLGRSIAQRLLYRDCEVKVYDHNEALLATARQEGFETYPSISSPLFASTNIIIGATGNASFSVNHFYEFLASPHEKLFLISASSRRNEFSEVLDYLDTFLGSGQEDDSSIAHLEKCSKTWGTEYTFTHKRCKRKVMLLADGFPINFYRPDSNSLPSNVIDLINAEIVLLSQYLMNHHPILEKKLYLLGHDPIPELTVDEFELLNIWFQKNLNSNGVKDYISRIFSPHPNETLLAQNYHQH